MKKLTALILSGILAGAFTVSASAHGCRNGSGKRCHDRADCACCVSCFADSDGDGICDNCKKECSFTDKDGDGICDNCGRECASANGEGCRYRGGKGGSRRCGRHC